jgi:hypothetical protein
MVLQFMCLKMGGAHPLTREADLQLDTDLPINLLDVRADVIEEQIVLVLVDLCSRFSTGRVVLPFHLPSACAADALPLVATQDQTQAPHSNPKAGSRPPRRPQGQSL